jgi:AcrR family transcriptional regulator
MLSERQLQIINESILIIDNKGIQGLTIKNLSKAIGISEPGIYRHFKSKTDILLTMLDSFLETALKLAKVLESNEAPATQKLDLLFSKLLELLTETPAIVSVIFSEEIFKNEEILKMKIIEILNFQTKTIEKIISDGQNNNEVRKDIDKRSLALMAMGSLRLLVKKWDMNNHNFNLSAEGHKLIEALKNVFVKKP